MIFKITRSHLAHRFDEAAASVRRNCDTHSLVRPLADWADATDRSLPFPLLHRAVGEIIEQGFAVVAAVPRVGTRKLSGLVMLLERVAADHRQLPYATAPGSSYSIDDSLFSPTATRRRFETRCYDTVRGVDWDRLRRAVVSRGPAEEPLGRFVPVLRDLPQSLWDLPLAFYASLTFADLIRLPRHGAKRIHAVVEALRRAMERTDNEAAAAWHIRPASALAEAARFIVDMLNGVLVDEPTVARRVFMPVHAQLAMDLGVAAAHAFQLLVERYADGNLSADDGRRNSSRTHYYKRSLSYALRIRWPEADAILLRVRKLDKADAREISPIIRRLAALRYSSAMVETLPRKCRRNIMIECGPTH